MAERYSQMLPLGSELPEFALPCPAGKTHSPAENAAAYLVMFICNHCPYVKHVREELARLGNDYLPRDVSILAINSNDTGQKPGDGPEHMQTEAETWGYRFPYLFDESQNVAKQFRAACTPDFFVYDNDRKLAYRGQLDASRPGNHVPVTGEDLRAALDALLNGNAVAEDQTPSIGCNIKWKPGNEPDYS